MKTTTIGRIGAIVAGAAMLGTAVASALAGAQAAVPSNLDKGFFLDSTMSPKVQVVVGEKAQASDGAAAGQIAAIIGNMAYQTATTTETGGTMEVEGGTTTCTPSSAECDPGNAQGQVKLSWDAVGMVGELQQKQMECDIYNDSDGLLMTDLDDGGDSGSFCDSDGSASEIYTPESTVGTTLVGACETGAGADITILKSGEFANEICTVCYNYCDIALGCAPHLMSEWVNITCAYMALGYDCDNEALVMVVEDNAIRYNVFTDDILTKDILDEDGDLIGQSYLGKIILGQNEYYVEDVTDDSITIVCGETGTTTTSTPMMYMPPAEGSACDAADSGDEYSIKLVGAQTIEEKGVVDVTLEVTKPDGTTEQVTSGISGTPVVGDIKVKLQRGTAASNVITGEQSFSADLLVWYVPSEYTFEDDERYTEEGVEDSDGIWELDFNGGNTLYVYDVGPNGDDLEDDEELTDGVPLPDDIEENEQWDDCYDEVDEDDNDTEVIRYLEFSLQREDETELPEDEMIQLPFNDGMYLLSDLQFGYMGLMNEDFLPDDLVETTTIDIEVDDISVMNDSDEDENLYRAVTVDFVDQWGDQMDNVRIDEGPFEEGDMFIDCDRVYRIDSLEYSDGEDEAIIEYSVKDGADWTEYEKESDEDAGDACNVSTDLDEATYESVAVQSQVQGFVDNWTALGWHEDSCGDSNSEWIVKNNSETNENDWELWVDKNADEVMELARTCSAVTACSDCSSSQGVQTEFKNDVWFCAYEDNIILDGATDTGGEDEVVIGLNDTSSIDLYESGCSACTDLYDDNDCEDFGNGQEDGSLISFAGAQITTDGVQIEEPEDSDDDTDVLSQVTMVIPEDELRPTIFFGIQSTLNTSSVTITEADEGTEVNIGGVDVMVEEFGVSISGGGIVVGEEVEVSCPSQTVTCPDVTVETQGPADLAYKLVVVEGGQTATNLVLMGGPSVNSLTKDLVSVDELCPNNEVIKLSGTRLVVAGCEAADTMAAAQQLQTWLETNLA